VIDLHLLRRDPAAVRAALVRRGVEPAAVDEVIELDRVALEAGRRRDDARAELRRASEAVALARRRGDLEGAVALQADARRLGDEVARLTEEASRAEDARRAALLLLPNLPAPEAPDGRSSADNQVVRQWRPKGHSGYREAQRVPHWEVGRELGWLDLDRGARLSGSMFPLFRGTGARLVRALSSFALDRHADAFEEIRPPTLVRTATMTSTGHLPKFADEAYHVERDDLWAIPTAEVPLTSLRRDEILEEDELPVRLTAATSCYRREAGAAGRDTRGLLRVHEFDKVELLAYGTPEQAPQLFSEILGRAEDLLQALGLEYRVVDLCAGDLGASSARTFDLEVYAPGCDQWLEVSSVSWFSDYQARRANIRYRPRAGGSPALVHTLNGSALAWPRIWAALVEVGRQDDGRVELPEVLAPYLGSPLGGGLPTAARTEGEPTGGSPT